MVVGACAGALVGVALGPDTGPQQLCYASGASVITEQILADRALWSSMSACVWKIERSTNGVKRNRQGAAYATTGYAFQTLPHHCQAHSHIRYITRSKVNCPLNIILPHLQVLREQGAVGHDLLAVDDRGGDAAGVAEEERGHWVPQRPRHGQVAPCLFVLGFGDKRVA